MDKVYPVRYDDAQYEGLEKAAKRFKLTGRQKAQRQINQLYMAFFGIIHDPIASASMEALIEQRRLSISKRKDGRRTTAMEAVADNVETSDNRRTTASVELNEGDES